MFNWRILVSCMVVAAVVAGIMQHNRNNHRFVPVPGNSQYIPQVLDTRTGQYCNPWGEKAGHSDYFIEPYCADLAKGWR